jgi:hypothetical protein
LYGFYFIVHCTELAGHGSHHSQPKQPCQIDDLQPNGGVDIMHISDMVMHVDNFLGENTRRNIEKALCAKKGVIHAHFNEKRPHLMLVSYDTDRTSSFEVLAQMMGQQVRAERIG